MLTQWTRLSIYIATGLTILAILFPPFSINGGPDEYGFFLSGPPSVRQALNQASLLGGPEARNMASEFAHYGLDFVRLIIEVAAIWGIYFALKRTVLKPIAA